MLCRRLYWGPAMKKFGIAIAIAFLIGTPAVAADVGQPAYKAPPVPYVAPVYNWTGFYVGGV
jgi:outer membrane immunogenic protein